MLNFTTIDHNERVARVAAQLRARGVDAYVGTRQAALHYLGGAFMPWRGAVIVTADARCEIVYWAMDCSRLASEGAGMPTHEFWFSDFIRILAERLHALGAGNGRLGLDLSHPGAAQVAPGMLTAAEYLELRERLPQARLDNGVDLLDDVMLIKTPAELERLRHAARVSDHGFAAGLAACRVGATENSVAGAIEQAIREHGSTWSWAVTGGTEVGSGERTGYLRGVTQQATERRLRAGEFVILDLHPMIDLYLADTAIPVFMGTPSAEQQRLIDCWESTVATLLDALRPGRPITEVVQAGLAVFERHGLAEFGLPLFGHGLGTCARTRPFLNMRSTDVVQPGMVVALGTHLYHPGLGGMRLEYPVAIDEHGAQPLLQTPAKVVRKPVDEVAA